MTDPGLSMRAAARIAGYGYLVIIVLAIFAEFVVRSSLVVPDDAATTVSNLRAAMPMFRSGIGSYLIVAVVDVVVALALYVLLKPVNRSLSLLAAWLRVAHAIIFAVALNHLLAILPLLAGAAYTTALTPPQLQAQVMLSLNAFDTGWLIGLVFFGLHCLFLGVLLLKSGYAPRLLGVLLLLAAAGYLLDSFAHFLLPDYADYATVFLTLVAVPALVAEVGLCGWLLLKAAKRTRV